MDFDDPSFRELLDALHDGVYITDADGITLKVNSAYEAPGSVRWSPCSRKATASTPFRGRSPSACAC